jgi:hypothetical protein
MRLLYENLTEDAAITSSSEDGNFPISNLQDYRLSRTFRTLNSDNQSIDIATDGDAAKVVCIANHNFSDEATIQLWGSNSADYSNPEITDLTWREDIIIGSITEATHPYWKVYVDDPSNADEYLSVGLIYIGSYIRIEPTYLTISKDWKTTDKVSFSISRQSYGDIGERWRELSFDFVAWTNAMKQQIETFDVATRAGKPFFLVVSDDEYNYIPPLYCIKTNDLAFTLAKNNYWKARLTFAEVK